MTLQGIFEYPGIRYFKSARYTQGYGVLPDAIQVDIVPQPLGEIAKFGEARFKFGTITIKLPGCAVDFATIRQTEEGFIERLRIYDSRWSWKFGEITKRYNERNQDQTIRSDLEKTPQEIANELFKAMGVQSYDVSGLPNNSRPFVNWECAHPHEELQKLCDQLGCRIVLGYGDDPARIVQLGRGLPLPDNDDVVNVSYGVDTPELPDDILICTGRALFQSKLELEAVGRDTDGTIKRIADLSYAPTNWDPDNHANLSEEAMHLAKETVFRLYRVKQQADGSQDVPGYTKETPDDISRVLSLQSVQVSTYTDVDGYVRPREAEVHGRYWPLTRDPEPTDNTPCDTKLEVPFRIFKGEGMIYFPVPIYKLSSSDVVEPDLFLTTSYHVRENDSDQPTRLGVSRQLRSPRIGTQPHLIKYSDIAAKYIANYTHDTCTYTLSSVDTNEPEVIEECNRVIDAVVAEYDIQESFSIHYRGLQLIRPDGAVRQVTFEVQDRYPGCSTFASINSETDPYVLPYRSRRRFTPQQNIEWTISDREELKDIDR